MTEAIATSGRQLSDRFKVWLCDVWGVVHNGRMAFRPACDALERHRANGGIVILITNAPRPCHAILPQLASLDVSPDCHDAIVSSGDVTRKLVLDHPGGNIFHLGPQKDQALLDSLPVNFVDFAEADAVLCTGLYIDLNDQPEDYDPLLKKLLARDLDMICANPDKVVQYGDRLIPCGGALAERYEKMGGRVTMAGKPFAPIYDACAAKAAEILGRPVKRSGFLALGDGMATDITGARDNNLALAFISGGIHDEQTGNSDAQELAKIATTAVPGVNVAGAMRRLEW